MQDYLSAVCFVSDDDSLSISNNTSMLGSELKRIANTRIDSCYICDELAVFKDGSFVFSTCSNSLNYAVTSDAETQPTSMTINWNIDDLTILEDDAEYAIIMTLREFEIYENTYIIKRLMFDIDIQKYS